MLAELHDLRWVGALADGQLVGGDQTLRLVADVYEDLVLVYPDDVSLDYVTILEVYEDCFVDGNDLAVLLAEEVLHC